MRHMLSLVWEFIDVNMVYIFFLECVKISHRLDLLYIVYEFQKRMLRCLQGIEPSVCVCVACFFVCLSSLCDSRGIPSPVPLFRMLEHTMFAYHQIFPIGLHTQVLPLIFLICLGIGIQAGTVDLAVWTSKNQIKKICTDFTFLLFFTAVLHWKIN